VGKRPSSAGNEEKELLAELRALYGEIDALEAHRSCPASTDCCRFGVTGREPYPTAIELHALERAVKARGGVPKRRTLPLASERRCSFLGDDGRCIVYAARPFGCRTFFCDRAEGEPVPRDEIARVSHAIQDLSARFNPRDPGPRPLSRWASASRLTRG